MGCKPHRQWLPLHLAETVSVSRSVKTLAMHREPRARPLSSAAMTTTPTDASAFIARWQGITASELSTSQSFVIDLCELLGVPRPHATPEQDYMFERHVTFQHGDGSTSAGRIDCYHRGAPTKRSNALAATSR